MSGLVFVYNVDASPVALFKDLVQGIKTGSTDCNLCDLTFGRMIKDRTWQRFVNQLPVDVDFQMRSTFRNAHPEIANDMFPSAWAVSDSARPELVISAEEMNTVTDLDGLRSLVSERVTERFS